MCLSCNRSLLAQNLPDSIKNIKSIPDSSNKPIIIKHINIQGNKKTKNYIILRELGFSIGDTLKFEELEKILEKNRNQVFNTHLFNDVNLKIDTWKENYIDILIEVEERWYIFPVPIFELADRNFNVWWNESNRSLSRIEYGIRFFHNNFRGRREQLIGTLQFGFTKKFELSYDIPNLNNKGTYGITPFISYIANTELPFTTQNNKQLFYEHTSYLRNKFRTGVIFNYRPNISQNHNLVFSYSNNSIKDTLATLNPNYFLNAATKQQYLYLSYNFTLDKRDIAAFPLKGYFLKTAISKAGLGIISSDVNISLVTLNFSKYFKLFPKLYGAINFRGKYSFPSIQPYFNQSGLGFGSDYLRAYQYYVIDGQSFAMLRSNLKLEIFNIKVKNPIIKAHQFKTIPVSLYLSTFAESGYVIDKYYNTNSPLANTYLYSYGIALDLVTFYDFVFNIEYGINHKHEKGVFIFGVGYDF